MINLYAKNANNFNNNGEATFTPIECILSMAINGVWQLEMTVPFDEDEKYNLIDIDKIVKVTGIDAVVEQTSDYQLFRIYDYRKQMDSTVYVLAYPIGMDARYETYIDNLKSYDKTASQAISQINALSNKYIVSTDISDATLRSGEWNNSNIVAILNGDNGFTSIWGGEICYDNYNIKVNERLGRTSGTSEVRYGKNIVGMSYEENITEVITRLYPVAKSGEALNAITEYKIANERYVDAPNASDYPIPHISNVVAPYSSIQMTDDGSANYTLTMALYENVKDKVAQWLYKALTGTDTGEWGALLNSMELGWLLDNYALTQINDGVQGVVEYLWRKVINDTTYGIKSSSVQSLIYEAIKAGFEVVLKDDSSPRYIGSASKKLHHVPNQSVDKYFYSYNWDTQGNYAVKSSESGQYVWVYANSKWNQIDHHGETTGATDTAKWKWYKVSGQSWKRYGNKKKKRYLHDQHWEVSNIWYWFDREGHGQYGSDLMALMTYDIEHWQVSEKTFAENIASFCRTKESELFNLLYTQMTDYCNKLFVTEGLSYPIPNITVDMVDLSKTTEYVDYEGLLKVKLGDTVKCTNPYLGVSQNLRITGVTFDVLRGFNSTVQMGITKEEFIKMIDEFGKTKPVVENDYIAGDGITIKGNVISATGMRITDVYVNGQSVTYGGKAYIDLDEISGEGLQWFEETEDALFGIVEDIEMSLINDPIYRTVQAGCTSENGAWDFVITGMDTDVITVFIPKNYVIRPYAGPITVAETGGIFIMTNDVTKFSSFGISAVNHWASDENEFGSITWNEGSTEGTPIEFIQQDGELGIADMKMARSTVSVDGEMWYCVYFFSGYDKLESIMPSVSTYLSVSDIPVHGGAPEFESLAEVISTLVPLIRIIPTTDHNYNGISREGNLAFFAGGDDEHGTNAPIKIYRDGTYEGIGGKVDDVKVDNVSVVTNKIANINTMTGATSSSSGAKGLVPSPLSADREKYLKGDGTWATPTDTQYSDFDGVNHGLVPAPSSGDTGYLKVDGTWDEPSSGSGAVIVNITAISGDSSHVTSDKNYNEIKALLDADKEVILKGANPYRGDETYYYYLDYYKSTSFPTIRFRNIPSNRNNGNEFRATDYWIVYDGSSPTTYTVEIVTTTKFANKLPDVTLSDDGCVLGVQSGQWQKVSGGGGGASSLSALNDVDLSSPTNGQVLKYNSTSSKWENANESGGGGGGIDYSTTEQDTGLKWIDGRPVYQKTYYFSSVAQGVSVLDSGFTEILYDHVWQTDIHWRYFSINIDIGNHGGTGGAIYIESYNNQGLYVVNSTGVDITDLYFTIRYTKTADL